MQQPAPLDRDLILTPAWLSAALGTSYPGISVDSIRVVETLQTLATKIRFTVEYSDGAAPAPRAFCVKGILGPDAPRILGAGISEIEARFYLDIAPDVGVRVPPLVYAGIDPGTRHGLVLLEDVIAAGGTFLTVLSPYSVDQTAATLDQLAQLHAAYWAGKNLNRVSWLPRRLAMFAEKPILTTEHQQELLNGPRGEPLPDGIRDAGRLHRALERLAERTSAQPLCLVHGDCHAGNLYMTDAGPGLVDFQMLQLGSWALDVSYHVAAVLSVEDRIASEQALLRHYLERLKAHGAEPPSWDDAWLEYRAQMVWGYYMWAATRLVEPHITSEFVRRLGLAVEVLDSYTLLGV